MSEEKDGGKVIHVTFGKRPDDQQGEPEKVDATGTPSEGEGKLLELETARRKRRIKQVIFFAEVFGTITPPEGEEARTYLMFGFLNECAKTLAEDPNLLSAYQDERETLIRLVEKTLAYGEPVESFQAPHIETFMQAVGIAMPTEKRIAELREEVRPKTPFERQADRAHKISGRMIEVLYPDHKYPEGLLRFTYTFTDAAIKFIDRVKAGQVTDKFDLDNEISREWIVTSISEEIRHNPTLEEDIWKIFEALWMMFKLPKKEETIDDINQRLGRMSLKGVRRKIYTMTQWFGDIKEQRREESEVFGWMLNAYRRDFTAEEKKKFGKEITTEIKRIIKHWELDDFFFKRLSDYFAKQGEQLVS